MMSRAGLPPTSVSDELAPTDGARFLLERQDAGDGARASYRAAIYTPDATYEGRAELGDDGAADVAIDAPEALAGKLVMFARLLARGAAKRRDDGLPPWPARVLRWRRADE
jgi:hypothetical protein